MKIRHRGIGCFPAACNRLLMLLVSCALLEQTATAADVVVAGKTFIEWNYDYAGDGVDLPGRLYIPPEAAQQPETKFPLVIFLHGLGALGSSNNFDNISQLTDGGIHENQSLIYQAGNRKFYLYAPQLGSGIFGSGAVKQVMSAAQGIAAKYNIDAERIYVTGLSLGGGGVREICVQYGRPIGASLIICGLQRDMTTAEAMPQVGKSIWQWHSFDDPQHPNTKVHASRNHVNAILTAAGITPLLPPSTQPLNYVDGRIDLEWGKLRYTEFAGAGHFIWNPVYESAATWDWVLAQRAELTTYSLQPGEGVLFDFGDLGTVDGFQTDGAGRGWNVLKGYAYPNTLTGVIPFARTTSGTMTTVALSVKQNFSATGTTAPSWPGYDGNHVRDGWETSGSASVMCVRGLIENETYTVDIYASSNSSNVKSRYQISGTGIATQTQTFSAYNNTSTLVTFTVTADARGGFDLTVSPDTANGGSRGIINCLGITRTGTTPPTNSAPVVNAGPDLNISGTSVMISGTVNDDNLPSGPPVITWSKLSGPGTVTFSPPNAAETLATFSTSGTYTLQLNADDGLLDTSDTVNVTVNPPPPPSGGTLFFQDFETSTSVAAYVVTGSAGANLFNDISPQSGTNAWSIVANKLRVAHSSTNISTGFARHTDLPGEPKFVRFEFDFAVEGFSTWESLISVYMGQISAAPVYKDTWFSPSLLGARIEILGHGNDGYYFKIGQAESVEVTNPAAEKRIVFYVNKSGSSQNYTGPDSTARTIPNNSISVFSGGAIVINNAAIGGEATSPNIADFFVSVRRTGTYLFDNIKVVDMLNEDPPPVAENLLSEGLTGINIGGGSSGSSQILAGGIDWRVMGSGNGLAGTADSFHFERCGIEGDFVMVARMQSLTSSVGSARAGIMIRDQDGAAGSRMVALATTTGTQYRTAKRLSTGGSATEATPSGSYVYPDAWVMLERVGDIISSAVSSDGVTFSEVDNVTLPGAPAMVYGGLFATSGATGVNASAVLSDFDIYDTDVMLKLNFEGSVTPSDYFDSTPTVNQMNHLNTPSGTSWSIENGKLKLSHAASGVNAGFTRYTNLVSGTNPAPRFVGVEFDISCQSSVDWVFPINFSFGQLSGPGPYGNQLGSGAMAARLSVRTLGPQECAFVMGGSTSPGFSSSQVRHVLWVINTSGAEQSYIGPDGISHDVDHGMMDLWADGEEVFLRVTRVGYTYEYLDDFWVSFDHPGTYTIDNLTVRDLAAPE
jgi:poly(3-hydroxybutyrate) depolymerase